MRAVLNHVSVVADDLETSVRFYEQLFGAERLPTPNFGYPVQWLRLGDRQLHLFERPSPATEHHHFAVEVDDLPALYERAREYGAFDRTAFGRHLYELPGDAAQLYLRDPGGNLVEVDAPGASALPARVRADMERLADMQPQGPEQMRARLYLAVGDGAPR